MFKTRDNSHAVIAPTADGPRHRAVLIGYFRRGNLGDDAMLAGYQEWLAHVAPSVELVAFPLPSRGPSGWISVLRLAKLCKQADSLTLVGGTHFHDAYGLRSLPILASHLALLSMARLTGCRVGLAGLGVGPLDRRFSRTLTRSIFHLATAAFVRDPISLEVVRRTGSCASVDSGFDLAALLPIPVSAKAHTPARRVAVSLVPYFNAYRSAPAKDAQLAETIADALRQASPASLEVDVLTLHRVGRLSDRQVSQELVRLLRQRGVEASERVADDPSEFLEVLNRADAVIATRYHAAILAFMLGKPLLIVAYEMKGVQLARQIGLPDYALTDPEAIVGWSSATTSGTKSSLHQVIARLIRDPAAFMSRMSPEEARSEARRAAARLVRLLAAE